MDAGAHIDGGGSGGGPLPEVVLFDLGGVLVELGGSAMGELTAAVGPDFWPRWLACRWVRAFERGRCSTEEFSRGVVDDWGLERTPEQFLAAVRTWPTGLEPGALDLVAEVRRSARVGCLSNTNEVHWSEQFASWGLAEAFDHAFASHLMGAVKPDPEAFDHVVSVLAVEPGMVLFLDDNAVNVAAARAAGLRSERVSGVAGARAALERWGVVRRPGRAR
ncbi:MAG: HAD-IA family hydrolase [Acidimicrobiales bacterium]